jgi:hypothetical protein
VLENVLTKEDTLIVIIEDEPNDTIVEHMKYLYHRDEIFVVIHNMKRLQFNMLNHSLVPKMTILTEAEETEFMKTRISWTDRLDFDPSGVGVVYSNKICRIERDSLTSLNYLYLW